MMSKRLINELLFYYHCQSFLPILRVIVGFKRSYLQLKFPISSEEEVVQLYEKAFSENENIKIAVIGVYVISCFYLIRKKHHDHQF